MALVLTLAAAAGACATADVPQAHRGQVFERTGFWAGYSGGRGFTGDVLGPGTHRTGLYGDIHLIDCSMVGENEPLMAATKDGVQFGMEINVRFSADCSPETVKTMLATLIPDQGRTITGKKLYEIYVRPTISEAVLQVVSPYRTMELNEGAETAARIDQVGAALKRNPEYLQFDLQDKMPDIYRNAGQSGNLIITAPNPTVLLPPKIPSPVPAPRAN
jgi:hypothetical protein